MPSFLDQFLDAGVTPESGQWTANQEAVLQSTRLLGELVVVRQTMSIPRRLGADASPPELSADKKIAKMVYNRLLTIYLTWGGKEDDIDDLWEAANGTGDYEEGQHLISALSMEEVDFAELLIQGAQMDWDAWWRAKKTFLKQHVRFMANNAVANNDRKNGNRFANRFANEYNSIGDVLDPISGAERNHKFDSIV